MEPELYNELAPCSQTEERQARQILSLGKPNWATWRISHGAYTGHMVSSTAVSSHGRVCIGRVAVGWQPFVVEGYTSLSAIVIERKAKSQFHV